MNASLRTALRRIGLSSWLLAVPVFAQVPDPDRLSLPDAADSDRAAFTALDADNSGTVSAQELGGGDADFASMDTDGNGELSPEELRSGLSSVASPDDRVLAPAEPVPSTAIPGGDLGVAETGQDVPSSSIAGGDTGLVSPEPSAVPGGDLGVPPPTPAEQQVQMTDEAGESAAQTEADSAGAGQAGQAAAPAGQPQAAPSRRPPQGGQNPAQATAPAQAAEG